MLLVILSINYTAEYIFHCYILSDFSQTNLKFAAFCCYEFYEFQSVHDLRLHSIALVKSIAPVN